MASDLQFITWITLQVLPSGVCVIWISEIFAMLSIPLTSEGLEMDSALGGLQFRGAMEGGERREPACKVVGGEAEQCENSDGEQRKSNA